MASDFDLIKSKFLLFDLKGSSYQTGHVLGDFFKKNDPFVKFLGSGNLNYDKIGTSNFTGLKSLFEDYCPGITDELLGLADGLHIDPEKLIFYNDSYSLPSNCSHFAVLKSITENNHIYVGRSYEWTPYEEDLILAKTTIPGKYSHMGFTCLLSGRHDGINEHGLTITASGGGIFNVPTKSKGLRFWIVIRSLLDQCKTVDEAKELIMRMPLSQFTNYIMVDRNSKALVVESADGEKAIKEIDISTTEDQFVLATNHYTLNTMKKYNELNKGILKHSKIRNELITSTIRSQRPHVSKESIRELLSQRHPNGLTDYHYKGYFGTLWQMIFDVTDKKVDICFGASTHNSWQSFNLMDSFMTQEIPVVFPNVHEKNWL